MCIIVVAGCCCCCTFLILAKEAACIRVEHANSDKRNEKREEKKNSTTQQRDTHKHTHMRLRVCKLNALVGTKKKIVHTHNSITHHTIIQQQQTDKHRIKSTLAHHLKRFALKLATCCI